jgi:hypothetical protein
MRDRDQKYVILKMMQMFAQLKRVYLKWYSWVICLATFLLFMYIIRVSQILDFYFAVVTSLNVGFADKVEAIVDPVIQLFNFNDGFNFNSILVIVVSLLQGVVISVLLYIKVFQKKEIAKLTANTTCKIGASSGFSGGIGAFISFFGVGCVPCKTALISPLLSVIFSAGGPVAFASSVIMDAILLISILLSVYSILKMLSMLKDVYESDNDKSSAAIYNNKEDKNER